jgi:hypothetical protein
MNAASAILALAGISVSGYSATELDDALAEGVTPPEALPPVAQPSGRRQPPLLLRSPREVAAEVAGWPGTPSPVRD